MSLAMSDPPSTAVLLSPVARKPRTAPAFVDSPSSSTESLPLYASAPVSLDNPTVDPTASPSLHPTSTTHLRDRFTLANLLDRIRALLPPTAYNFLTQNVGLTLVASAQIFFVAMALTVKYFVSTTSISTATLIFVRMSITGVLCTLALKFYLKDPNPFLGPEGVRRKLVLRGLFGWVGLASNYNSLRGLTVSDSVTIQFLSPSVTALLGFLFLREKMSRREIVAGFFCLAGVVLVSRPPFIFGSKEPIITRPGSGVEGGGTRLDLPSAPFPGEGDTEGVITQGRLISVCWALASTVGAACAYITIRSIGNKANALHSIGYFSYMCTVTSILWMLIDPAPIAWVDNLHDTVVILAIGIFGFVAQTLLTMGLQREKAGRAGLAMYLQVVIALIVEFLLWHTIPSFLSLLGTAIILVSAFWAALSSTKPIEPAKSNDPEAQAFSRTATPIPAPHSDRPPLGGQHYSYNSVHDEPNRDTVYQALLNEEQGKDDVDGLVDAQTTAEMLAVPRAAGSRRASMVS